MVFVCAFVNMGVRIQGLHVNLRILGEVWFACSAGWPSSRHSLLIQGVDFMCLCELGCGRRVLVGVYRGTACQFACQFA